jgi:hypothetical protein
MTLSRDLNTGLVQFSDVHCNLILNARLRASFFTFNFDLIKLTLFWLQALFFYAIPVHFWVA